MSKKLTCANSILVSAVAMAFALALQQAESNTDWHRFRQTVANSLLIADKDCPTDPGKDITDDPHGANPHGSNPHGDDPHDEVHDRNLPANNPGRYFGNRT